MSTIIGTTLNADTIRKTGGSLGTDIRIKNTSVIEHEGGTSYNVNLSQSVAKGWILFQTRNTDTIHDSLNATSVTDLGQGLSKISNTQNMASADKTILAGMSSGSFNGTVLMPSDNGGDNDWDLASNYYHISGRGNGTGISLYDQERIAVLVFGESA